MKDAVEAVVADHTAGDPMREDVKWTYLSISEITAELIDYGFALHDQTVGAVLDALGFSRRPAQKRITMGHFPDRDEQFQIIAGYKRQYLDSPNPIFSIDTKKKEVIGDFHRPGRLWSTAPQETLDHDFTSAGGGRVVPHGIYDLKNNHGHVTLGLSRDTSQFACDSFALYWQRYGRRAFPRAKSMLWLCDCGGSNNPRHHVFKEQLQHLVNKIGIPIRLAHYPPYCSKYNPIEHRMFPHVTRACQGVIFRTLSIIKQLIQRTWTNNGLYVTVDVITKNYEPARQAVNQSDEPLSIQFDKRLPLLNYIATPQ